jgi:SET domain-containing protein 6
MSGDGDDQEDDDEEREEEPEVAVMVPMADMLNAAYERDNARLFSDEEDDMDEEDEKVMERLGEGYTMISTKLIKAGEQIVSPWVWLPARNRTLSSSPAYVPPS